ncbi:MAG: hypothetical protein WKG07_24140 [Hymenobacter sp.]
MRCFPLLVSPFSPFAMPARVAIIDFEPAHQPAFRALNHDVDFALLHHGSAGPPGARRARNATCWTRAATS